MTDEQHQFIEDFGQHMMGWGLPRTTGRVYGYLLLCQGSASLDEIVEALGIAKSGASVAARQLVQLGMARARGERGSRRLRYEALIGVDAIMTARTAQTRELLERLSQGARVAPPGPQRERLAEMVETLQQFVDEAPDILRQIRDRRQA
ncbi:MAG TPA: hypothetical protein VMU89_05720 [Thermomicrobiaceae bacterium]|nr:hypothetical protein [Thermomicrobiaceae bacterium]